MGTNSKYIDFFKSNRADFVRGLSALEGILPTRAQTEQLLDGVQLSRFDAFETKVLSNIIQAWSLVLHSDKPTNNENALQFYKSLQNVLSNGCTESDLETAYVGRFRETGVEVRVGNYFPPTFSTSRESEIDFLTKLGEVEPTVDGVLGFYLDCMRVQYFANTNKRTAYLFCNFILMHLDLRCMLTLPVTQESNKKLLRNVKYFYEHPKQKRRLIKFLKNNYLRSVV